MKNKRHLFFLLLCFVSLSSIQLSAQGIVEQTSINDSEANFELRSADSYLLEIAGPDGYYFKEDLKGTKDISLSNKKSDGTIFSDGLYKMQVTPILELTDQQRTDLGKLRAEGNLDKIAAYTSSNKLPQEVSTYNYTFRIQNGKFLNAGQKEYEKVAMPKSASFWQQDHPALYASLNPVNLQTTQFEGLPNNLERDNSAFSEEDQVFLDDVIVDGSLCVGQDCVNGENFGFDTQRIKENNLRIHFDDTSASASFPANDWRISINDSSNGGSSYFAIEDATAGTTPFRVLAGAGNNALYVSNSGGNVGMGTASPVVELHVTDGDSPTMRLEQNGASGWTPQTWDIAGNETNFFVRDVTNGSKLPFKIKPGAPDNSLYVDAEGDIGLGTANPGNNALQVESGDVYIKNGLMGIGVAPTTGFALNVAGIQNLNGGLIQKGDQTVTMNFGSSYLNSDNSILMRMDGMGKKVGIGTFAPTHELTVCGTIGTTAATVSTSITCSSDFRLKKNIETLNGSLEKLMKLRGVSFNWKTTEFPDRGFNEENQLGFIAQEVQTLFPELVITNVDGYMAVDYSKITPVLVQAIKEQQQIIDQQQKEIDELSELKAQVASLAQMVSELNKETIEAEERIGEKK